jgi:hypothetical protein
MSAISFLNPALLWGLGLAVIPLIIHLLFRRRFRRIDWAPMHYLKLSIQRNRRRIRLEQLLLLLLRTAALVLLFLLLARPILHASGLASWLRGSSRSSQIVLIDDSLSMGYATAGRSALDRAQQLAGSVIGNIGQKDHLTLVLASQMDRPLLREVELTDPTSATDLLAGLRPSDTFVNWESTFTALDELLATSTYPIRDVTVITDLRRAGWQRDLADLGNRWAGERVRLRFFDVGSPQTDNVAIVGLEQADPVALVGTSIRWEAIVHNGTDHDLIEAEANFLVDGQPNLARLPAIAPGETARVPLAATFLEPGLHHVALQLPADALHGDDQRADVVQVADTLQTVLVDGEPSAEPLGGETDFLAIALSLGAAGADVFRVEVAGDADWDWLSTGRPNVIVLANVASLAAPQIQRLERLVEAGTGLMIFPGDGVDPDNYNQFLFKSAGGLLPAAFESIDEAEITGLVLEDQATSPLGALGQLNPAVLARVKVRKFQRLSLPAELPAGVRVLARLNDATGSPLAVEKVVGRGRVLLWTITADKSWSDWPTDPSYVLGMREAAKAIARSDSSAHALAAGEALRRPVAATHEIVKPQVESPAADRPLPLSIEIVPAEPGPASQTLACADTRLAGLYKLTWQDTQAGPGHDLFAVNPDVRESDLARIEKSELRQMWGALEPEVIDGSGQSDTAVSVAGQEIWRTLAAGLLGLLFVETCFATWAGRQH